MNRTLSFAAMLMLAAPLFAADPKPVSNPTQQPAQADSPLVAAAKRANRLGKKPSYVITNDNLVTAGGHFTTTAMQVPLVTPLQTPAANVNAPPPQPQTAAAEQAKQKRAEEEQRRRMTNQVKAQHEDDLYENEDPAATEHKMQQMQSKQPDQMQQQPVPPPDQTPKQQ